MIKRVESLGVEITKNSLIFDAAKNHLTAEQRKNFNKVAVNNVLLAYYQNFLNTKKLFRQVKGLPLPEGSAVIGSLVKNHGQNFSIALAVLLGLSDVVQAGKIPGSYQLPTEEQAKEYIKIGKSTFIENIVSNPLTNKIIDTGAGVAKTVYSSAMVAAIIAGGLLLMYYVPRKKRN
jgi:hypothetical protein